MKPFTELEGVAVALMRDNIDTDVVIRIDRLIENRPGELGPWLFEAWRYRPDGAADPEFPLNQPRFSGARFLIAGRNFGCGSSREHAVWALQDFGVDCVVAPSFGDIFESNCYQNGVLPVTLPLGEVERLAAEIARAPEPRLRVNLRAQTIAAAGGAELRFEIDPQRRQALLEGLDDIGATLKLRGEIEAHEAADLAARPWIYRDTEESVATKLLILAGDGIGAEIMPQARRVVEWFRERRALRLKIDEELFGVASWKRHGSLMPEETWRQILGADAILFGAIGSPEYASIPAEARKVDWLLRMRKELDLYCNYRPIRMMPALLNASTLRPEVVRGVDMVIVRELAGGIYFNEPRGIFPLGDGERRAVNTTAYTTGEIRRIGKAAFDLARTRAGRVCSVDKANVLESGALWRETVQALRDSDYPDIELSHMYADNCAMQLVRAPAQFDVIVTENLFGDILSDCAAMVAGSLGVLPSASLGPLRPDGGRAALYEPIHGSAPDIAGRNVANPIGAILSFGLCLRYSLKQPQEADRLERAVEAVLAGGLRTPDIVEPGQPPCSTAAMGDAVIAELENSLSDPDFTPTRTSR